MIRTLATIVAVLGLGLAGCNGDGGESGGPRSPAEQAAVEAVRRTLRPGVSVGHWECGPMEKSVGGIGVLGDGYGAFLVDAGGRVFAASGAARTWSFDLPTAKAGVDIEAVKQAVAGQYRQ